MSSAASSPRVTSRPTMQTRAPMAARPVAVALPMPPVPPVINTTLPAIGNASDTDHDLSVCMPGSDVFQRGGGVTQRVGTVEDRCHLPTVDHPCQSDEIFVVLRNDESAEALARESERRHGLDRPPRSRTNGSGTVHRLAPASPLA